MRVVTCRRYGGLAALLMLGSVLAGGCSGSASPSESATAGWTKAYAGTTLNFIGEAQIQTDMLKTLVPDFTAKTGITVNVEGAPAESVVQKLLLDFTTHKAQYECFSMPSWYLGAFAEKGYIMPVDEDLKAGKFNAPGFDSKDIIPAVWNASSVWKGKTYGVPSESPTMMMFYRKDIMSDPTEQAAFKAKFGYDLAPAKTWAQYKDQAQFFTRKKGAMLAGKPLDHDFFGIAMTGKRHIATVFEFYNYMWTYGGDLFDKQGNLVADQAANVKSLEYWKSLTAYAPPGYTSYTWDEVTSSFQQDTVFEAITWGDTAGAVEDPANSKVGGKMGFADIPVDPDVNKVVSHYAGWTWAINQDSPNKDACRLFIGWALSKDTQTKLAQGGALPALTSVFEDATLAAQKPYWPQELASLRVATSVPRLPEWGGIQNELSLQLSRALAGEVTPAEAMKTAQANLGELLKGALPISAQ
jgi:multiple sugar transport system substrate-binding protein